jgi:predicted metal-dependent phosphoesterase TrpH
MKLDMHIHSSYSRDASAHPKDIVSMCKKCDLDGLAITDHNSISGWTEAETLAKEIGLVYVRGVELTTKEGHVLAYGLNDLIPRGLPVEEAIEKVHEAGGVAVAAHPKRFPSGIGLELARTHSFDGIEILNGGSSPRSNAGARKVAESKGSAFTAGSDAHELDQVGKAYTVFETVSTSEDVLDAIRKKRTSVGGRSRSMSEGIRYSWEILVEWIKGDLTRV